MADERKIRVEVLTPEGQVFDGEVAMVSTRTKTGSLGILANHAPLMAMLDPTELALYESKEDGLNANRENATRFAQAEGYLQVADNRVLVLVEEAIPPDQVDRGAIESKLEEAQPRRRRGRGGLRGEGALRARRQALRGLPQRPQRVAAASGVARRAQLPGSRRTGGSGRRRPGGGTASAVRLDRVQMARVGAAERVVAHLRHRPPDRERRYEARQARGGGALRPSPDGSTASFSAARLVRAKRRKRAQARPAEREHGRGLVGVHRLLLGRQARHVRPRADDARRPHAHVVAVDRVLGEEAVERFVVVPRRDQERAARGQRLAPARPRGTSPAASE